MITIVGDTHTHTIACDHAYSTVLENVSQAKKLGHSFLCLTEHGPAVPGGASRIHFGTLSKNLPRVIDGVTMIRGVELNILDYDGGVDLPEALLKELEWVIASYHPPCIEMGTTADHTRGWIKVAENPHIHVIGHCGRTWFEFEHRPAIKAFKEAGKIVEINASSLNLACNLPNCRDIAILCAEMSVPVVVSSDAHICLDVGNIDLAGAMLEEIGFPEELILNADYDRFLQTLRRTSGRSIVEA